MFRTPFTTALAAIPLAVVVQPVSAAPGTDAVTQRVEVFYGDLNLNTDAGALAALDRLNAAATKACGGSPQYGVAFAEVRANFRACRAAALLSAVATIDQPAVTAAFRASSDSSPAPRIAGQ